jgi:C-terminal processing protease CtpA/Prc
VNAMYTDRVVALDGPKANISIRFPDDDAVGVLRVHGFGGERFVAELDSVFTIAETRQLRGMVLDLRGNGGGVDMYGANLVSRFTDKPFRYFDHIHVSTKRPSFTTFLPHTYAELDSGTTPDPNGGWLVLPVLHPGVSEQPPAAKRFSGPLVVLMDGGTFSTAADVTATLRGLGHATFIGEESGGAYEGNTSGMSALIYLPHTGLRVWVQMYGYVNAAPAPKERGRGTLPDITLPQTVRAVLRGEDAGMAKALQLARGTP